MTACWRGYNHELVDLIAFRLVLSPPSWEAASVEFVHAALHTVVPSFS